MVTMVLSFFIGVIAVQFLTHLINVKITAALSVLMLAVMIIFRKKSHYITPIFVSLLGFSYANGYAAYLLSWSLPSQYETVPMTITGIVASLPVDENNAVQFIFYLTQLTADHFKDHPNRFIKVTWANTNIHLKVGDKWRFTARLKHIHGIASPGAFNEESLALEKKWRASANISLKGEHEYLGHLAGFHLIDQFRQRLQMKIREALPATETSHWLETLMIGEHGHTNAQEWAVLQETGTNHLMAIAGLHIGLAAGWMHVMVSFIWRRIPLLALALPASEAGAYGAMLVAILYSALAGFSLPTQRACIMLLFYLFMFVRRQKINPWLPWSFALLFVLILNPLSVLSDSFWLSFCTLALIVYGLSSRVSPKGHWWQHGRIQWVVGIGLIPLSIYLFYECSLLSFMINAIAIPWVGLLILPFCLISTVLMIVFPGGAKLLLFVADKSMSILWKILVYFSHLHIATWHVAAPNIYIFITLCIAYLIFLFPIGLPGRWLSFIFLLPLLFYQPLQLADGQIKLTLLDVGQGLSAIVQTKKHILVFDAGAKFGSSDMGENVVVPYLLMNHIPLIDVLIVSHEDNDHIGGVASLASNYTILKTKTSIPDRLLYLHAEKCKAGDTWQWDGVHFTFLYPGSSDYGRDNDSSCVLLVDNGKERILLPGDIEKYAEKKMIRTTGNDLHANIMIAPHHGSKTSAVEAFVRLVNPSAVIYSVGYKNRYHFPHQDVVQLYQSLGVKAYDTAKSGTLEWLVGDDIGELFAYREAHPHYWNGR